jgi:hypothetical protein
VEGEQNPNHKYIRNFISDQLIYYKIKKDDSRK